MAKVQMTDGEVQLRAKFTDGEWADFVARLEREFGEGVVIVEGTHEVIVPGSNWPAVVELFREVAAERKAES